MLELLVLTAEQLSGPADLKVCARAKGAELHSGSVVIADTVLVPLSWS